MPLRGGEKYSEPGTTFDVHGISCLCYEVSSKHTASRRGCFKRAGIPQVDKGCCVRTLSPWSAYDLART